MLCLSLKTLPEAKSTDLFLSTFVLDLLSDEDIFEVLRQADNMLDDGGYLALVGLTPGYNMATQVSILCDGWAEGWSRIVAAAWATLHYVAPSVVGGCRAQVLEPYLEKAGFKVESRRVVSGPLFSLFPLASEAVVARKALH
eukprot:scaffold699_cov385-Prasinococcus_capsulatus_cf.AAC.25